jgi:hypothetical protein
MSPVRRTAEDSPPTPYDADDRGTRLGRDTDETGTTPRAKILKKSPKETRGQ